MAVPKQRRSEWFRWVILAASGLLALAAAMSCSATVEGGMSWL